MKSLLYASFLTLILAPICLFAQQPAPSIQWQQVYGGSMDDQARDLELTPDGGCIFTGYTSSEDHDVTVNQGGDDVWVVKLTSEGIIEWQKSLGGKLKDWGRSVTLTNDGGYLITGYEKSTDGELSDNHGAYDLLVIKLNSSGDVLWDKELGGSFDDNGYCAIVTSDNGYLIGGYTLSLDGDVSGNHGMEDFWVIKLDNNGNYEWQKTLGGSGFEEISNMIQTSDGNYLIAGYTNSTDGDVTMNHGSYDFWIVKLSTTGELIYEKTYGGTKEEGARDIIAAPDGGYIIAGYSFSDNLDVTENHGKSDVWVIKVDVSGNLEWQKSYGGTEDEYCYSIAATNSGNYILAGNSNSSNGTLTSNKGLSDYWVLEINSGGDLIWQRSLGGSDDDVARNIKQTPTGEYLVSGYTLSNNGDVTNNYGGYDCWLISLCTSALYFFDADLDGYGNPDLPLTSCSAPSGFVLTNTDCNDSDAAINPQAGEMCNSIDDDCDGQTDEDLACTGDDEDADGYTITDGDCNDMDPTINPGAAEVCNSIDDNCNAQVDEGVKTKYFADADGDQYGDVNTYFFSCIEFSGYVTDSTDCNDNDATINISSIEICNGIDDNCNGFTDEVESIYYADGDGDGYGDPNTSVTVQSCTAPTDFVDNNLDCNDADLAIYAGATEICNQIDDDCDGQTDEDLICDGADVDGDGYAVNQGDCNDSDPTINPGAAETCNSIDDNCNAQIDEGVQIQYFADADGDLFGDANNYIYSCIASTGYVADNTDCNDNDATINSSSPEICNGIDDNCNGLTDEVQGTYYADVDADGYGNPNSSVTVQSCTAPFGYVSNNLDCNDADAAINPNGTEICNLIDDDCDGQSDEGLACGGEDIDADGYTLVQGDCDDNNPTVHPGAPDLCNGLDDDCNGQTDENAVSVSINPSGTVYSCKNVPITFTASGSNITHYQWYRDDGPVFGETNNTYVSAIASRFHVIASNDFGCSVKSATTLVVPIDLPTATVTVYNDGNLDLCAGTIRLRSNEENNVAYQWYTNGSVIPGATNQDYIPFNVGNYGVMVTDLSTGCFKYSTKIHVTNSCRLNPPDSNNDYTLSIFPNPAVENISIVLITDNDLEGYGTLQVMNTLGQLLYKKEVAMINREVISEINLAGLAEGIYFLNIVTDNQLYSQQFIISH